MSKREMIRAFNDAFRTTLEGGKVFITSGVDALPSDVKAMAIKKMMAYDAFDDEEELYGEHHFGSFTLSGYAFFFRIDAYDKNMEYGSPDPTDPTVTKRVLVLMLAEEY